MIPDHTLVVHWQNDTLYDFPAYKIECPFDPHDPQRPCVIRDDPDNPESTTTHGCIVQQWLDADLETCAADLTVRVPIGIEWNGDGWDFRAADKKGVS